METRSEVFHVRASGRISLYYNFFGTCTQTCANVIRKKAADKKRFFEKIGLF